MGQQITQLSKSTFGTEFSTYDIRGLTKHPIIKMVHIERKVDPLLKLENIQTPLLQAIYSKDEKAVKHILAKLKKNSDQEEFNHELTLAFWLSIHQEDLAMAQLLMKHEYILKQLVVIAQSLPKMNTHNNSETHGKSSSNHIEKLNKQFDEENDDSDDDEDDSEQNSEDDEGEGDSEESGDDDKISEGNEEDEEDSDEQEQKKKASVQDGSQNEDEIDEEEEEEESSNNNSQDQSSQQQSSDSGKSSLKQKAQPKKKNLKGKTVEESEDDESETLHEGGSEEESSQNTNQVQAKKKKKNVVSDSGNDGDEEEKEEDDSDEEDAEGSDEEDDSSDEEEESNESQPHKNEEMKITEHESSQQSERKTSSLRVINNVNIANANKRQSSISEKENESDEDEDEDDEDEESSQQESSQNTLKSAQQSKRSQSNLDETSREHYSKNNLGKSKANAESEDKGSSIDNLKDNQRSKQKKKNVSKVESSQSSVSNTDKEESKINNDQEDEGESESKEENKSGESEGDDDAEEEEEDSEDNDDSSDNEEEYNSSKQKSSSENPLQEVKPQSNSIMNRINNIKTKSAKSRELKIIEEEKKRLDEEMRENLKQFNQMGITEDSVQAASIPDRQSLFAIKVCFRTKLTSLMTSMLKYAISKGEETLACILTAYYDFTLSEEMLVQALAGNYFQWLMFLWAFEKNVLKNAGDDDENHVLVTFVHLFDLIKKQHQYHYQEMIIQKVKQVLEWKLLTNYDNNILQALLHHHYNELAIEYMGCYSHLLSEELFVFSLTNGNSEFLKVALLSNAFDKMIFREESVINQMLQILREGYRINFILNSLTLIDIHVWKNKHLKEILDCMKGYLDDPYDKNRLLLSSNPLMSIALAAQILKTLANSRKKFENECFKIKEDLMKLGRMFVGKIEDQRYYEKLVMSTDYKGRTVLKTITQNNFEELMEEKDAKAENLMLSIWNGKESHKCDGNVYGYSMLSHILMSKTKRAIGKKYSFYKIVTNFFQPNFDVDYKFQYKYRSKSISYLFYKEFICACIILLAFQYINYQYLTLFSDKVIKNTTLDTFPNASYPTDEEIAMYYIFPRDKQLENVENSKKEYKDWSFLSLICSSALIYTFLLKLLYNFCSKQKIMFDKWSIMDVLNGVLNMISVFMISSINPASYILPGNKDMVDYYMILVLCIAWLRFFAYFLVIKNISKLLLTLLEMIADTLSFLFIVCCFILIMASIFTTLYQDTNPEKYGGLGLTVQSLFNDAMGVFDYDNMEGREISHSLLTVFTVFFANILLMNYLIAILSTTYDKMKESGVFKYKCNLHTYCERYLIAFEEKGYGELIIHPPPISFFLLLMIPFTTCRSVAIKFQFCFKITLFWIENVALLIAFLVFEMCLVPLAYIKVWFNIFKNTPSFLHFVTAAIMFIPFGPFLMILFILKDITHILTIFNYLNGCKSGRKMVDELAEIEIDPKLRLQLYNEVRATTILIYKKIIQYIKEEQRKEEMRNMGGVERKKTKKSETNISDQQIDEDQNDVFDPDFFYVDDNYEMHDFQILKKLIINEWKEMKRQIELRERKRRNKGKNQEESQIDVNSALASSIKKISKLHNNAMLEKRASQMQQMYSQHLISRNSKKQKKASNKAKDFKTQMRIALFNKLTHQVQQTNDDGIDMSDFEISEQHIKIVDQFLTRFTITTENSFNEHIDIMIMLKALPNRITENSLLPVELFNFRIIQDSITAFQNINIVNAFEFFDDKNRERVQIVKENMLEQKSNLNDVKNLLDMIKDKIERNQTYAKTQSEADTVVGEIKQEKLPNFLKKQTTIRRPLKGHGIEVDINLKKKQTHKVNQMVSLGKSTSLGGDYLLGE